MAEIKKPSVNCYNARMHRETIDILNRLNATFYRNNSESFDRTRQSAWLGWERVVEQLKEDSDGSAIRLLDVACGNMRFEKYLIDSMPEMKLYAICVDSCDELAVPVDGCEYRNCDIVDELLSDTPLNDYWGCSYDMVVSFGFFHHVPSAQLRLRLLEELIAAAKSGGIVAVSLWRFADDEKARAKAERTTAEACVALSLAELEESDYLLGWNDTPGTYRYCHSFDDSEIESLIAGVAGSAHLVDRFKADGHSGNSNEYLVFRR